MMNKVIFLIKQLIYDSTIAWTFYIVDFLNILYGSKDQRSDICNSKFVKRVGVICYQCTLAGLSTRPTPLIIFKSLQFRTFWSQSKALFMIRCMSSVGSGSETFGALKVTIYVKFFELSVHKMSNFLRISACQWTIPSGLFAKKNHSKFFCSC